MAFSDFSKNSNFLLPSPTPTIPLVFFEPEENQLTPLPILALKQGKTIFCPS